MRPPDQMKPKAEAQEVDPLPKKESDPDMTKTEISGTCEPKERADHIEVNSFNQHEFQQSALLDQGNYFVKETVKRKRPIEGEAAIASISVKQDEDGKDKVANALEVIARLSLILEEMKKGVFLTTEKGSQNLAICMNKWRRPPQGPEAIFPSAHHSDVCLEESVRIRRDKVPWIKELKESQKLFLTQSRLKLITEKVKLEWSNLDP